MSGFVTTETVLRETKPQSDFGWTIQKCPTVLWWNIGRTEKIVTEESDYNQRIRVLIVFATTYLEYFEDT